MFRFTTKVKVAGAVTAGALALGGVGVYAANNGSFTATTTPTQATITSPVTGSTPLTTLFSLNSQTSLTAPAFNSKGACISWFAHNRDLALASSISGGNSVRKNYHGKLMSSQTIRTWCQSAVTPKPTTSQTPDATESEAPEATQSETPDPAESEAPEKD
jgi:hypothetical protein